VDADRMLLATRSALNADGDLISPQDREQIDQLMAQLEHALQGSSAADTEAATDALAKGTEAFAAHRMNRGIQQALAGRKLDDVQISH
jgi:molecular chaperone HscA